MGGSSPSAQPVQLSPPVPPKPPPGHGAVKSFFEQIFPQLASMQKPTFQGSVDPGLSPSMQNVIRGAQTYSQSPMPNSLEQASGTLGQFMQPSFQNPAEASNPPPDFGFGQADPGMLPGQPPPNPSFMAYGGGAGMKVKPMQFGGAGGLGGFGVAGDTIAQPGGGVHQVGDYWFDAGGNLAFNPNDPSGGMGDSRWGNFWDWVQGQTGFTPGPQHGPDAQPWNAQPPPGFDFGRGGPVNPTDLTNPRPTPFGWWSPEPGATGGGFQVNPQEMPPWLQGLNDEQMREIFDFSNIPPGMLGPGDMLGEQIAGEQAMDWGGSQAGPAQGGGGGGRGGGGGGGVDMNFQGIPGYDPMQVNPEFVAWDPGNPEVSMVPGKDVNPPPAPAFHAPPAPQPAPPPAPGGGGGGAPPPPGGGGAGSRPPQQPPPAASQQPPTPPGGGGMGPSPQQIAEILFGSGGVMGGGIGLQGAGGGGPGSMGIGNEVAIPFFAEGDVVDHPQLAMIGEAGPEVVLPLSREARDPRIRGMQEELGLPVKPMQAGGGAGLGASSLNQTPDQRSLSRPTGGGGGFSSMFTGGGGGSLLTKPATMPGGGGPQSMTGGGFGSGGMGGGPSLGGRPAATPQGLSDPIGGSPLGPTTATPQGAPTPMGVKPGLTPATDQLQGGGNPMASWGLEDWQKPNIGGWFKDQRAEKGLSTDDMDAFNAWRTMKGFDPIAGDPGGGGGGGAGGGGQRPPDPVPEPVGPPGGGGGGGQDPFGPTSAMDVYRASVPVMQQAMNSSISDAMAQSGLTGNRFSSSAQNTAADIGGQYGLQQNQLMANLLYGQTQSDLDRSLQAAGMAPQNALAMDQIMQNRLKLPFQIGAYEQGRQDDFARLPYQDFQQNALGFLPEMFQLAASQGGAGGMQGQFGVQQSGGSPGFMDYASAFAPYMALFMARGGAAGSGARKELDRGGY